MSESAERAITSKPDLHTCSFCQLRDWLQTANGALTELQVLALTSSGTKPTKSELEQQIAQLIHVIAEARPRLKTLQQEEERASKQQAMVEAGSKAEAAADAAVAKQEGMANEEEEDREALTNRITELEAAAQEDKQQIGALENRILEMDMQSAAEDLAKKAAAKQAADAEAARLAAEKQAADDEAAQLAAEKQAAQAALVAAQATTAAAAQSGDAGALAASLQGLAEAQVKAQAAVDAADAAVAKQEEMARLAAEKQAAKDALAAALAVVAAVEASGDADALVAAQQALAEAEAKAEAPKVEDEAEAQAKAADNGNHLHDSALVQMTKERDLLAAELVECKQTVQLQADGEDVAVEKLRELQAEACWPQIRRVVQSLEGRKGILLTGLDFEPVASGPVSRAELLKRQLESQAQEIAQLQALLPSPRLSR